MPPPRVQRLCKAVGYWPKRTVVSVRASSVLGSTVVTLDCRHEVERGKKPKVGSATLCEQCARWEGSRQRAAIADHQAARNRVLSQELETLEQAPKVDKPADESDNPGTSST
jgi:hypothetical protein